MPKREYYFPSRRLVSQEDQAMIERPDVPRSKFSGSWSRKMTFEAGLLIPFLVDEVLPGDHLRYDVTAYIRMDTPLFPILDQQRVDTHIFYVPNRLLWANWARFMGEQSDPTESIDIIVPQMESGSNGFDPSGLADYFGIAIRPQTIGGEVVRVSALPFRAYNLIYNEWFRDQNLEAKIPFSDGDGPDSVASDFPRRRNKSHDYFTSALPWPQKFTAPSIPLVGLAPIQGIGFLEGGSNQFTGIVRENAAFDVYSRYRTPDIMIVPTELPTDDKSKIAIESSDAGGGWEKPEVYADLSETSGISINLLRQAFLVQQLLERDARGGTRYTEIIRSHFGVTSPDMRLQRPEYIGGGSSPLEITPIAQTAPTALPVGTLGAAGTSVGQHKASFAATEHGWIIGIMSVKSELSYEQGIPRMFSRRTRFDFYWPSLAELGEQAILRKELYATGVLSSDDLVFGYQERWHEYRQRYSEVVGRMRTYTTANLKEWHLAQNFTDPPVLSKAFIQEQPPMSRVLAAGSLSHQYLADILIRREAVRAIPMFGTPATLGRF